MGRVSVESLWPTVDTLVQGEGSKEFIKSSRVGSKAFLTQKCSNSHGMFLPLAEYKECGWRGFIAIQRVVKTGDGEVAPPSCKRWQLFSSCLSRMEGCNPERFSMALSYSF
ncbi:hypothetical protein SLA2020_399530 [Shorea laevis]